MTAEQGTPSAVETLREAARQIREDWTDYVVVGTPDWRGRWLAVAAWLDEVEGTTQYAWETDRVRLEQHSENVRHALATARAYLGGQP
jgi:hypothetical protein